MAIKTIASMTYEGFVVCDPVEGPGKVASGTKLEAGTIVTKGSTGLLTACGASDTPWGIVKADVDAAADQGIVCYIGGQFNGTYLKMAAGKTGVDLTDDQIEALRDVGIYITFGAKPED